MKVVRDGVDPPGVADIERTRGVASPGTGLSNAGIAAELVVSEHTAKTHVAHIVSK